MKKQLSISIDESVWSLSLKDRRNVSAYIEDLLKSQYAEDNKTSIAKAVGKQLLVDEDFVYKVRGIVETYIEERRNEY